jgi:hypothetical protein
MGGGVVVFVKDHINCKHRPDLETELCIKLLTVVEVELILPKLLDKSESEGPGFISIPDIISKIHITMHEVFVFSFQYKYRVNLSGSTVQTSEQLVKSKSLEYVNNYAFLCIVRAKQ